MRVEKWRSARRLFHGAHPWTIRSVRDATCHEGLGSGSIAVLARDPAGRPRELVPALFALAGAWERAATAAPQDEEIQRAWIDFRARVDRPGALTPIDAATVTARTTTIARRLGWELSGPPEGPAELVITVKPRGHLTDDGHRTDASRIALPLSRPWLRGLSLRDAWNDQLLIAEAPEHFALFAWGTGA